MATISNRLTSTGNLLVNGTIDEITYTANKVTANTVFAAQFDEVTYNPSGTIINRFSQTETFSTWIVTNASVTINNTTSPTGSFTASKLTEDSTNAIHRLLTSLPFVNGTTYTMSTYAKAAERRNFVIFHEEGASVNRAGVQANLQTGTVVNYTTGTGTVNSTFISNVGNGWYRFGFSFTASANATVNITYRLIDNAGNFTYTGDGTSGLYVWGAQFEQGSSATIYQPIAAANTLASSTTVRKIDQAANYYIQGQFDEFTGAPVVDTNLTMWVDAGQTSSYSGSGATWTDLATNSANITLVNSPTFSSTNSGGAFTFSSAVSQYGTGAGTPLGINAYTKSVWFNLTTLTDNNLISSSAGGHFMYFSGSNKLYCGHSNWPSYNAYPSTATFSTGVWYNACLTFDTTNGMTLYINGVQDSTYTARKTAVSGTGQCNLGCFAPGGNLLNGILSQAMVYNRALTADEVAQNFNALRRRFNI